MYHCKIIYRMSLLQAPQIKRLRKNLTLLYQLTKVNIKLQYENSYLGILWYVLGPLFLFITLLFVFTHRLGEAVENYPLYLLLGMISWNFFVTGAGRCMKALHGNAELIKSLPIKLEMLILSAVLYTFIAHLFELVLFGAFMYWYNVTPQYIMLYCLVLFISFIFTLGLGFLLSSLYILIRDIEQVWSVFTRAWWFATPIFYTPTSSGPGVFLSQFNPPYYMVHLPRELLIYHRIPPTSQFVAFGTFAVLMFVIGYSTFMYCRPHFIERL
jgi:ABC-2 type transport system permease protein